MKHILTIASILIYSTLQAQWYSVNSNTVENIHNIFFVDSLTGYCVGGGDEYGFPEGYGVILETTDGGENWSTIFSQDSLSIQHIAVINENNYTKLYGFGLKNGTSYLVSTFLSTQFRNWTVTETLYRANDVQVYDDIIYFSDDTDQTLKKIQNNVVSNLLTDISIFQVNENGIVFLNNNVDSVYAYALNGTIMFSNPLPPVMSQNQIQHAQIASFDDTLIVKGTYPGLVTKSVNQGANWNTYIYAPEFQSIIINSQVLFGMDNLYQIKTTLNAGQTWQIQDSLGVKINRLYFYNESIGFAVGEDGSIFKTTNGGNTTSIAEIEGLQKVIKVFPNPTRNILQMEVHKELLVNDIRLYNQRGQLVKQFASDQKSMDISKLADGIYFLKINTNKGLLVEKIAIKK